MPVRLLEMNRHGRRPGIVGATFAFFLIVFLLPYDSGHHGSTAVRDLSGKCPGRDGTRVAHGRLGAGSGRSARFSRLLGGSGDGLTMRPDSPFSATQKARAGIPARAFVRGFGGAAVGREAEGVAVASVYAFIDGDVRGRHIRFRGSGWRAPGSRRRRHS